MSLLPAFVKIIFLIDPWISPLFYLIYSILERF
jgi:hypothetical protein